MGSQPQGLLSKSWASTFRARGAVLLRHIAQSPEDADPGGPSPDGWNLIAMVQHKGGIGNAARMNVRAMQELAARHRVISYPSPRYQLSDVLPAIHGRSYLHFNPAGMNLDALIAQKWFREGKNVGFWAWETTQAPAAWRAWDKWMAQIWVPSQFVREALLNSGFKTPIFVVPHAIEKQPPHTFDSTRPITFLVQFDGHSRFARKRPDWSLQAIISACLRAQRPARIIIKCHHDSGAGIVLPEHDGIEIQRIDTWLDASQMERVWNTVDALVSLNRGEGFGLPMMEAMARGVAVVATDWSASREYLTEWNSYPVAVESLEDVTAAGDEFFRTGQWAKPSIRSATEQVLRCIADYHNGAIENTARQARETADDFSFAKMISAMSDAITKL